MTKIMVVDDDADITELVCLVLKNVGFDVESFNYAAEAMEKLKNSKLPDLLLLDMRMPDISGLDFVKQVIADEKLKDLKIVFFTATADIDKPYKKYHILGIISKPFEMDDFIKQIKKFLK